MTRSDPAASSDADRRILEAVRSLEYGSVEVVVHDSQVVQIERREKVRLDKQPLVPPDKQPLDNQQVSPVTPGDARPVGSRRPRQADTGPR
jgi:hypothetical protein